MQKLMVQVAWLGRAFSLVGLITLAGCGRTTLTSNAASAISRPVVCDLTKMAYQSPAFIDRYLGPRPHSDYWAALDPSRRMKRHFEYMSDSKDVPYISVTFEDNKATDVTVFFNQQQSPDESAHRLGLRLSDFRAVSRTNWLLTVKGQSHGVIFKSLTFTNLINIHPATWNVIADFTGQAAQKPAPHGF